MTLKQQFQRLACRYPATQTGLRALMADKKFRRLFPHATLDGITIDFGDGEEVDVFNIARDNEADGE